MITDIATAARARSGIRSSVPSSSDTVLILPRVYFRVPGSIAA